MASDLDQIINDVNDASDDLPLAPIIDLDQIANDAHDASDYPLPEILSEAISAGVDDACDDLPKYYHGHRAISAGVDDACDDFPTAEEEAVPYGFIF